MVIHTWCSVLASSQVISISKKYSYEIIVEEAVFWESISELYSFY